MSERKRECRSCRHYRVIESGRLYEFEQSPPWIDEDDDHVSFGECCRFPPMLDAVKCDAESKVPGKLNINRLANTVFPHVWEFDLCGEFDPSNPL